MLGQRCRLAVLGAALSAAHGVQAAQPPQPSRQFDGTWETTVSCPNTEGALGFSYRFPSIVKDGVLHGQKGEKDKPGWLQLDGGIRADGSANLYVDGPVCAAPFAVGQRPAGTPYGYHVATKFTTDSGTGTRVEGRPCTVTFDRTKT